MRRPWVRTYVKDWAAVEEWFPEASVRWDEIGATWPIHIVVNGFYLSVEDGRCWADRHKDTCECRVWDDHKAPDGRTLGRAWIRWIKNKDT